MIKSGSSFAWDTDGRTLTVCVSGEIDHHGATLLRRGIDTLIWEHSPQRLVLDLSAISLMDSSGLGFIMGRYKLMSETGGELVVLDPSPCVSRVLRLTGFDKKVRILSSQEKRGEKKQKGVG